MTTPSISEMTAGDFGRRASNNSSARGRPPVMSFVLACSRGILARTLAGVDLVAVLDLQVGPGRQEIPLQEDGLAVLVLGLGVDDFDPGLELFILGFDDDLAHQPGDLVLRFLHRHLLDDVVEDGETRFLGQDEGVERVPFGEQIAGP